jgi:DNA-binding IclR family transcriptional regulator
MADGVAQVGLQDPKPETRNANPDASELSVEFRILDLFKSGRVFVIGPADVERAGIATKGSASRKLHQLADAGYLEEVPAGGHGGKFCPGIGMARISFAYFHTLIRNNDAVLAVMTEHAHKCREVFAALAIAHEGSGSCN